MKSALQIKCIIIIIIIIIIITHRCLVTPLPATGVDKTDNLPIGINKTLHMPRLIVVFTSFYAFILALKKSGEVEQRDRHLCAEFQVRVW